MTFTEKRQFLQRVVGYSAESYFDSGVEIEEQTGASIRWWYKYRLEYPTDESLILIPDDMAERFLDAKWDFGLEQNKVRRFREQSLKKLTKTPEKVKVPKEA